jgi:type II secretory ATPase GspE/PulE/Tfp pilus assembly ATPase PilB-like protein/CheY-like chemotaxis protein
MRILAVEEDALTALLLHEALEQQGHAASIVRDGEAAWEQLQKVGSDLVLVSWDAGRIDGVALCQRIRASGNGIARIPVHLVVDSDTPENRRRAAEAGASGLLAAPLDPDDVAARLMELAAAAPMTVEAPPEPVAVEAPPPVLAPETAVPPPPIVPFITIAAPPVAEILPVVPTVAFVTPPLPPVPVDPAPQVEIVATGPATVEVLDLLPLDDDPHDLQVLGPRDLLRQDPGGMASFQDETAPLGRREKLGEILVRRGKISEEQLAEALEVQRLTHEKLGTVLIGRGWVREEDISAAYSRQVEMTFVAVEYEAIDRDALQLIPRERALRLLFLPLAPLETEGDDEERAPSDIALRVAIGDPWNTPAIDLAHTLTRRRIHPVLAESSALRRAIEAAYNRYSKGGDDLVKSLIGVDLGTSEESFADEDAGAANGNQAPIIKFVNSIIAEGVRRRASDIHIEPYKTDFEVRYRIDGQLIVAYTLPRASYPALISRIKVMGEMDIAEKRAPQDGRVTLLIDERQVQFRISSLPNQFGERVVMRILDKSATQKSLEQLSFSPRNQESFEKLIHRPHGIILVTGPTGSGKTTTLYAALNALKSPTTNIMTCEDPIEYEMDRISQSNVNPKAGLTFAAQLRAILRQDPDVVLVGEIRDGETAEIAFKAALTGHLVLSTLHCNEAAGAPNRLIDMGVEPYLISSALIGALAQRLVRRLCPECRVMAPPTPDQKRVLDGLNAGVSYAAPQMGQAVGCPRCNGLGTAGRVGVHEVLVMNEPLQHNIMQRASTSVLQATACQNGMVTMVGDALEKVVQGIALLDDVKKKVVSE